MSDSDMAVRSDPRVPRIVHGGWQPELVPDPQQSRPVEKLPDVLGGALREDDLVQQTALGLVTEIEPVVPVGPVQPQRQLDNTY